MHLASKGSETNTAAVLAKRERDAAEQRRAEDEQRRAKADRKRRAKAACSQVYVGKSFSALWSHWIVQGFSPASGEVTAVCADRSGCGSYKYGEPRRFDCLDAAD